MIPRATKIDLFSNSERVSKALDELKKFCMIFKPESQKDIFQSIVQEIMQRQYTKSLGNDFKPEEDIHQDQFSRFETEFTIVAKLYESKNTLVLAAVNHMDRFIYCIKRTAFEMNTVDPQDVMREASILQDLNHPNIAKYNNSWIEFVVNGKSMTSFDPVSVEGLNDLKVEFHFYIQTELCSRDNIVTSCKGQELSSKLDLLADAASGISYIHERNIVHCNLKPSNILMGIEGIPKLCDFGCAANLTAPRKTSYTAEQNIYDAPEFPNVISTKCDVYSFGLIAIMAIAELDESSIPDIKENGLPEMEGVPDSIIDLLERCISEDPNERPSIDEISECFENASSEISEIE